MVLSPSRRLSICMLLSVTLHAALLGAADLARLLAPRPAAELPTLPTPLQAWLLARPEQPLLKDTMSEGRADALPPAVPAATSSAAAAVRRRAQRQLAEHVFYPPEAIAQGLEGEVRLLLTLAADGTVLEAEVVGSSGHGLLDRAAAEAAYALRRLPAAGVRELILPVQFKLQ